MPLRFLLFVVALVFSFPLYAASPQGRDPAREAEIEKQLQQLAPNLVEPFRNARLALDKNDDAEAARLLSPICAQLPAFDPALRRLGGALTRLGKRDEGRALIEKAVKINRSAANLVTLAHVLAFSEGGTTPLYERERALALLLECRALPHGDDPDILFATAQLAFQLNNMAEAGKAVADLEDKYPDIMHTHYFAAILAATEEHWVKAEREIRAAQKLGLDQATVQKFLDSGVETRATGWKIAGGTAWVVGFWAIGLLALFLLGVALSKATLRQVERSDVTIPISPAEHRLRRLYRNLLNVAGIYYYISLPIVVLIVVGSAAAVIFACMMMGFLPIKILVIIVIATLATIWAMGRSLFLRVKQTDPGRSLERAEAEGLWQLTDEVARTLDTRPIDEIRITPGTDLCVYERGSWREKMENRAKRVLVLGTAVMPGFKQDAFRSVLAHEYGHFANRDTAGGDIALRVQNDILKFYYAMLEAGQATWINAAFHFLRLYHFIFRRVSHGATRLQEVLADRVAAQTYGAPAFESGLRHVIRRSIEFGDRANREIESAIKDRRPLQNLYEVMEAKLPSLSIEQDFTDAINRPTTPDDTHPGPLDRFRLIARVPAPNRAPSTGVVWDLFKDREALVKEMMALVEKNVASHR